MGYSAPLSEAGNKVCHDLGSCMEAMHILGFVVYTNLLTITFFHRIINQNLTNVYHVLSNVLRLEGQVMAKFLH